MSYITTRLSGFVRSRLMVCRFVAKRNFSHTLHSNALANEHRNYLPAVSEKQYIHRLENYSTAAARKQRPIKDRTPRILSKLLSNRISLQFDEITAICPKLFTNYNVTVENGFNIMKSCSQLLDRSADQRLKLVNEAWNELVRMVNTPTKDHLILLLQAYRRAGLRSLDSYESFFEKYNCPIDADIYAELMYITCQNDKTTANAEALFKVITDKNIPPNDRIFNALILGYSKQGVDAAEKVLDTMKSMKIERTLDTNTELIKVYALNGVNDKATELLEQSDEYSTDQLCDIIETAAKKGNETVIKKAMSMLPETIRNSKMIAPQLQNICIGIVHANRERSPDTRLDPYQLIIQHLPVPQFEKEDYTEYGVFLLKEMIITKESVPNILRLCENYTESNRNLYAIHTCCMYSLAFNLPSVRDFLEALAAKEQLRPHYFWPLIARTKNQTQVVDHIKLAVQFNTILDTRTILEWILPRTNALINSQETLKALTEAGVRMLELKTALITYLLNNNRAKESLDIAARSTSVVDPFIVKPALIKYIKSSHFEKNSYTICTLIKKLQNRCSDKTYDLAGLIAVSVCDKNDNNRGFEATKRLLTHYERVDVKISQQSAQAILRYISKVRNIHDELSPLIKDLVCKEMFPPKDTEAAIGKTESEIDSLKHQLVEFQANDMPTHGILYRLFMKYMQHDQYDDAIAMKKQCDERGVLETPAMLSSMLKLYTATKDEVKALQVLRTLQNKHPNFKIDTWKMVDLATLLVQKNRADVALKIVIDNMGKCRDRDVAYYSHNIFNLLNATVELAAQYALEDNLTSIFLEKLKEQGYCDYANNLLGAVVREWIEKKNIHGAVVTYEHYATNYRKTPQSLNLLTLLVQLSNDEKTSEYSVTKEEAIDYLQRVLDLCKEIHGSENTNINIILAFALAGYEQPLRKILINPTVKFNADALLKNLNYLKGRSKLGAVVIIARCAKGLPHASLREAELYEFLLNDFVRTNDYASAIELYREIEGGGAGVSKKFSKTLTELLTKNDQPLPEQLKIKSF